MVSTQSQTDTLLERDARALGNVLKVRFYPLAVERAQGCTITDVDGVEYLDFMAGWAVANTGYGHPGVVEPVMAQMQKTSFATLTALMNEPAITLAERLVALMPGDFEKKAWFGLHGSDATDALSKLVPMATKRPRLVSYIGGYHGQTGGSAALSGHTAQARVTGGGNVVKVPYPYPYRCLFGSRSPEECGERYLSYIEDYVFRTICPPEDTAGIIIEPVQSDGGDIVPPDNYLPGLEALCRRHGIMLLIDEVKVGFGRTGTMFGFQNWGITPDAVALGKSIGSGVAALSAVVGRKEILDVGTAINMYTVAGNPVSATAGLATLDTIERDGLVDNAREIGEYLLDGFTSLMARHQLIGDVRGKGMILGVELVRDRATKEPAATEAAKVVYRCKELGLVLFYGGIYSNVLEITPPLTMTREEAQRGLDIIDEALSDVVGGRFPTRNSVCTPGGEVTQQVITVAGKIVYTTLEELVSPNHTALVVMDMQRDFCSPGGVFDRRGIDISMYPALTERVAHLLRGARDAGVTVIYVCMTVLPNRASESPAQIRFNMRLHQEVLTEGEPLLYTVQGSKGADILPELTPRPDELIISKYRSSGFWGPNLDLILRSNGIESMVLVGCTTEGCVESTARDALFNDYYVIVPEDCIASDDPAQHDASLLLMRHRFDVVRSEAVLAIWSSSARYVAMEG